MSRELHNCQDQRFDPFAVIFLVRNSRLQRLNLILIPINVFVMDFFVKNSPWQAEGNVYAFSIIFLALPLFLFILIAAAIHCIYISWGLE